MLTLTPIADADIADTVALWQRCDLTRPWNDPAGDIARARQDTNATILLGRIDAAIVASVMVGHDGHRGWVYYLAVDPAHQGKGFGRILMTAAEDWLRQRDIAKLMLMVRPENASVRSFYGRLGYDEQPRTLYAKWLDGRPPTP